MRNNQDKNMITSNSRRYERKRRSRVVGNKKRSFRKIPKEVVKPVFQCLDCHQNFNDFLSAGSHTIEELHRVVT